MLRKDLSSLPKPKAEEGERPDANPRFAPKLVETWFSQLDKTPRPKAADTRLRNSQAGMCGRAIQYDVLEVEPSNPPTPADINRMGLGTMVHDVWQEVMKEAFLGCQTEAPVVFDEFDSSGHADLFMEGPSGVPDKEWRTVVELKTTGGYGFKMAIGARGPAEGPKLAHKLQAALNGVGLDADEIVLVYISLENLSVNELKRLLGCNPTEAFDYLRQFTAEWTYPREVFEPWAYQEMDRLNRTLLATNNGTLATRNTPELPSRGVITDPRTGAWSVQGANGAITEASTTWVCGYCRHRETCITDGMFGSIVHAKKEGDARDHEDI